MYPLRQRQIKALISAGLGGLTRTLRGYRYENTQTLVLSAYDHCSNGYQWTGSTKRKAVEIETMRLIMKNGKIYKNTF